MKKPSSIFLLLLGESWGEGLDLNQKRKHPLPYPLPKREGIVLAAAALAVLLLGCELQPIATNNSATSPAATGDADDGAEELALAVDSLRKLAEGVSAEPVKRTYFYFNQWLSSSEQPKQPWQPDQALDHLPLALKNAPGLDRLSRNRFEKENILPLLVALPAPPGLDPDAVQRYRDGLVNMSAARQDGLWLSDIAYFQQTLWLHDIAQRVSKQSPLDELKPWLKHIESSVGLPEAEQLATAERLFDWTIRNLQLDPLPPMPKVPAATAGERSDPVSPAQLGELGPGYGHLPVQTLLYGHADAHERSRIFIQLCRQAGIDAVMLAVSDEASPIPRPWTAAALIGGQLYLFDCGLGLPVPGPGGKGIATLDQVAAEPGLLRQLDVAGEPAYPIAAKDLTAVIALIDAEPAALSRRMQALQTALPRGTRLILSVQPGQLEAKIRNQEHNKAVSTVSLWRAPFEALVYQIGQLSTLSKDPAAAEEFDRVLNLFNPGRPLMQARNLHLQGRWEDGEKELGARSLYLMCRKPNREIQALKTNPFFRASQGLQFNPESKSSEQEAMLDRITTMVQTEKHHATYWLGLSYYEEGNFATTLEFLGKRIVGVSPPSSWDAGARYNLARCYEDLGQLDLARQWLQSDKDSPQRSGNLLRANWLATRAPAAREE